MEEGGIAAEIKKTQQTLGKKGRGTKLGGQKSGLGSLSLTMVVLCLVWGQVSAFTAYDCSNKSNMIESCSLLEPDACAASDKAGEMETTVYGEIVQTKQDRMIPVFRCQVIETIVSQYCGHFSLAGITMYIRFREPKALESWECYPTRSHKKVVIGGCTVQAKIGATMSHAMFLSRAMDDNSNCETGIINFLNVKTLGGQTAQGLMLSHS
jgi:hypothetical protein